MLNKLKQLEAEVERLKRSLDSSDDRLLREIKNSVEWAKTASYHQYREERAVELLEDIAYNKYYNSKNNRENAIKDFLRYIEGLTKKCETDKCNHYLCDKFAIVRGLCTRHSQAVEAKRRRIEAINYRKTEKYKVLDAARKQTEAYKEQQRLGQKRYKEKNREKVNAHAKVHYAVSTGKLTRLPCEVCGEEKTEGHHDDYSKPLEVRWLCRKHHGETRWVA